MRVTFYEPRVLSPGIVQGILTLVSAQISEEDIGRWTRYEQLLAYDWAIREYLHASDNTHVRRRPMPSFVSSAKDKTP